MKRPEKKYIDYEDESERYDYESGFNSACDAWEKFLPSEEEIEKICEKVRWFSAKKIMQNEKVDISKEISNAIHKRLKGEE